MLSNEEAIKYLHTLADDARKANYKPPYAIAETTCLALDLGASAIKTIDDMSDVFQKLITLDPSDIDNLTSFLKTYSVSEIVATLNYLKENNHHDNN